MTRGIPKDKSVKRRVLHRLKISRGHLDKVIKMVEDDEYCLDVVNQSIAVFGALKEVNRMVLKNHLETCVADEIRSGNTKKAIDEVMAVINKNA